MSKLLRAAILTLATSMLTVNAAAQSSAATRMEQAVRVPATQRVAPPPVTKVDAVAALPTGLFSMDDRAIIIVGGKEVSAGEVKRQIRAELDRNAVIQETPKVARQNQEPMVPQVMERKNRRSPGRKTDQAKVTSGATPGSPGWNPKEPSSNDARLASELVCRDNVPPKISRVAPVLSPGASVTLQGSCFGARTGTVEIIGPFANGKLKPAFTSWSENRIELQIPTTISGAGDQAVAVTVITADGARSVAVQSQFQAARERVEVPARHWTPSAAIVPIDIDPPVGGQGGGLFAGIIGAGRESYVSDFHVTINPECALDELELPTTRGKVHEVRGWEIGPPNESNIQIVWSPVCTTTTTDYLIATSSQRICSADIQLRAWASCPAGRTP